MNTTQSTLNGSHLRAYETIFQHPISHNLNWREVLALMKHLGQVEEGHNGNLKITRNGQTLLLHRPHTKDVAEADEVMTLRHFLQQSETLPPDMDENAAHWLLVIDHHQARIFRSDISGTPPQKILPREPEGRMHTLHDSADVARGKELPDAHSFFEPIAQSLKKAARIMIFGTGTGTSSEMEQFIVWLKAHHPELSGRVIGSKSVDEHHLSNDQLLAEARDFLADLEENEAEDARQDNSWKKLL